MAFCSRYFVHYFLVFVTLACSVVPAESSAKQHRTQLEKLNNTPAHVYFPATASIDVFVPSPDHSYAHHPQIAWYADHLYVMWSYGITHEDARGQRIRIARSAADLQHWETVLDAPTTAHADENTVQTAGGFFVSDHELLGYFAEYKVLGEGPDANSPKAETQTFAVRSGDGASWSAPVDLGLHIVPTQGPIHLSKHRLALPANFLIAFTDSSDGLTGWHTRAIDPSAQNSEDNSDLLGAAARNGGWSADLAEITLIEHPRTQRLVCLMRALKKPTLYASESDIGGERWKMPIATHFSNADSKSYFGVLPDGREFVISNPDQRQGRDLLVFALSKDGLNFSDWYVVAKDHVPVQYPGRNKGGSYAYPQAIVKDQRVYMVASVGKERIRVWSFELPQR